MLSSAMDYTLYFILVLSIVGNTNSQSYDPWNSWTKCSTPCGVGSQQRQRRCSDGRCIQRQTKRCVAELNPDSLQDNDCTEWTNWSPCSRTCGGGFEERERSCVNGTCVAKERKNCRLKSCLLLTNDADDEVGYEAWQEWSQCSATCGQGQRERIRDCKSGNCKQRATQTCSVKSCGVPEIVLGDWQSWGTCSETCGTGNRKRIRNCIVGVCTQTQTSSCRIRSCPGGSDNEYEEWEPWEPCSVSCGTGEQRRIRRCVTALCQQVMKKSCFAPTCQGQTREDRFLPWVQWSQCSKTCGGGTRRRSRKCKAPANCVENEAQSCALKICNPTSDVRHGEWSQWSQCSKSCGSGEASRHRTNLISGKKQNELKQCTVKQCDTVDERTPVWSNWSACSVTCGTGISTRDADCRDGKCQDTETKPCILEDCKETNLNEKYGPWLSWSECDATCGFGFSKRERYCRIGECKQSSTKTCRLGPCPTDYTEWEDWSQCTVTCGFGTATRKRYCTTGICEEKQQTPCEMPKCCEEVWEDWMEWQECHKSCGGGFQHRKRVRKNPISAIDCPEDNRDIRECNMQPCIDGTWGSWGDWTACSLKCGTGVSSRKRKCTGTKCEGDEEETMKCNTDECVQARWSGWSVWSKCTVTCGNGERARARICINGEQWDDGCIGSALDKGVCEQPPCIKARWSKWSPWRPCTATCGEGTTNRERLCIDGNPGDPGCGGLPSETNKCELAACTIEEKVAQWSYWTQWSDCPVLCGLGTQSRSRICSVPELCNGESEEARHCDKGSCPGAKVTATPGVAKLDEQLSRSIGSNVPAAGDIPWQVVLFTDKENILTKSDKAKLGGGSLVNDKWVLTSAHIMDGSVRSSTESIILMLGGATKIGGILSTPAHAQFYRASQILKHSKFNKRTYDFDLALIEIGNRLQVEGSALVTDKLGRHGKVVLNEYVRPVALPCISGCDHKTNTLQNGIQILPYNRNRCLKYARRIKAVSRPNVVVSGYESNATEDVSNSQYLRLHNMKLLTSKKCREDMRKVRAKHKRARYTGRNVCTDKKFAPPRCVCQSGDPLVKQVNGVGGVKCWVLVGVVTFNWACSTSSVQYYADVPDIIAWIARSSV